MASWAAPTIVDRTTDRWQRIRDACGTHAANGIDLDEHADMVCATVEAFTTTGVAADAPSAARSSGNARKDSNQ